MSISDHVVLVSIPGLRPGDLRYLPGLRSLVSAGDRAPLVPSFPCASWPIQANLLTGQLPRRHGVTASGYYQRQQRTVELWDRSSDVVSAPMIWDTLRAHHPELISAAWFPMAAGSCRSNYVCSPEPHYTQNPEERDTCYTRPGRLYNTLRHEFGPYPHADVGQTEIQFAISTWMARSASLVAHSVHPHLFYLSFSHLLDTAQQHGPDSPNAHDALADLDRALEILIEGFQSAYEGRHLLWLVTSEFVVTPVDHVSYPNRRLREAGLLQVKNLDDGEHLDLQNSLAWAFVDHQYAHVYIKDATSSIIREVTRLFTREPGIDRVLYGPALADLYLDHPRSGEVVLISSPDSWQAYYWWMDDTRAPQFARRTTGTMMKPAVDPLALYADHRNGTIPLNTKLIQGSYGAPASTDAQRGILLSSQRGVFTERATCDTDIADLVLQQFGI